MSGIGVDFLFEKIIERLMEKRRGGKDREISEVKDTGFGLGEGLKGGKERRGGGGKKKTCC